MANCDVAGTHSDIYVERAYIFRDICIQKYVYSGMFGYVQRAYIHIYTQKCPEIFNLRYA